VNIRRERPEDAAAIREVLVAAFGQPDEADLVERLRHDGELVLALVADEGGVRGHVAFPRLRVENDDGAHDAVGLAPIAVAPSWQRRGIGSALIAAAHRLLAASGESLSFVLGDPAYYTRFGYDVATAAPFRSAYAGAHFMALRLEAGAPRDGNLRYPAAFDDLV